MHRLACDLILGEVDVATLLGDLPREEVYGGAFVRQPLTAAHKDAIKDVLRL